MKKNDLIEKYFLNENIFMLRGDLPLEKLKDLNEQERLGLVSELLVRLKRADWRAVVIMGELKVQAAMNELKNILNNERGAGNEQLFVDAALSLWQITNDDTYINELVNVMQNGKTETAKVSAAFSLIKMNDKSSLKALCNTLCDNDETLRIAALTTMLNRMNGKIPKDLSAVWQNIIFGESKVAMKKCQSEILKFLTTNNYL